VSRNEAARRPVRFAITSAQMAMAVSSGAKGLEAVVVYGAATPSDDDLAVVREFAGDGVLVFGMAR